MSDYFQMVREGVVGCFWPDGDSSDVLDEEPERGYLRIGEHGVEVETLVEDVDAVDELEDREPTAIVSVSSAGAVLVLQVNSSRVLDRHGGSRTSSIHYTGTSAVGWFSLERLRSRRLLELQAHFHGVSAWAGAKATTESTTNNEKGLLKSWMVRLEAPTDSQQRVDLGDGRTLCVEPHWNVGGPEDRRELSSPTAVKCVSTTPTEFTALLRPILRTQDLINFAHQGLVPASTGIAEVDIEPDPEEYVDRRPWFWNRSLMAPVENAPDTRWPLFHLETIGGVEGLRRWIELEAKHPRAVQTVVGPYRQGFASPEMQLLYSVSGIETWVKSARPAEWAQGKLFAQQLARRVGEPFAEFVGDPERWGSEVFGEYNALKHDPEHVADRRRIVCFAESARLLLGVALLNEVAGSGEPGRVIFGGGHLWPLGDRVRKEIGA